MEIVWDSVTLNYDLLTLMLGQVLDGDDKQLGLNAAGVNFGFGVQFEELIWSRHFAKSGVLYAQAEQNSLLVRKHSILDFISSLGDGRGPRPRSTNISAAIRNLHLSPVNNFITTTAGYG